MKKLITLLATVSLTSCTLSVGEDGKPISGIDQESLARLIEIANNKINQSLRDATK